MAEKNPKVTSYRRFSWMNIGTFLFGAIFVYLIISLVIYLTRDHMTYYEVTAGSISGNYRYSALALKSETVEDAPYSGYVTYYVRSGSRASVGTTICTIGESSGSRVSTTADGAAEDTLTADDYQALRYSMASFALNYSDSAFYEVYDFKSQLQGTLLDASSTQESADGLLGQVTTDLTGFISYTIDGMETLTESDLTEDLFNRNTYRSDDLRLNSQVKLGDPIFKVVEGSSWALYFPISSQLATQLQDRTSVRFRFMKDDTTFTAPFSIVSPDGSSYGKITLENSLARYVSDRFLEIELLMDSREGLKVPRSAIAQKVFYRIPQEYITVNEDTDQEVTLLRETFAADGSSIQSYVTATVYDKDGNDYLVATDLFSDGDYVVIPGTTRKHQITEADLETIEGVYNINKGYAVFRQVTIIDQNEEFCIVSPSNPYGLAAHDFIALDASTVSDDDIVY